MVLEGLVVLSSKIGTYFCVPLILLTTTEKLPEFRTPVKLAAFLK